MPNSSEDEMTLDQYLAEFRIEIAQFETYWRDNHASESDEFPMEMGAGDWDEQFLFFRAEE